MHSLAWNSQQFAIEISHWEVFYSCARSKSSTSSQPTSCFGWFLIIFDQCIQIWIDSLWFLHIEVSSCVKLGRSGMDHHVIFAFAEGCLTVLDLVVLKSEVMNHHSQVLHCIGTQFLHIWNSLDLFYFLWSSLHNRHYYSFHIWTFILTIIAFRTILPSWSYQMHIAVSHVSIIFCFKSKLSMHSFLVLCKYHFIHYDRVWSELSNQSIITLVHIDSSNHMTVCSIVQWHHSCLAWSCIIVFHIM